VEQRDHRGKVLKRWIKHRQFEANLEARCDEQTKSSKGSDVRPTNARDRVMHGCSFARQEKDDAINAARSQLLHARCGGKTHAVCPHKHVMPTRITRSLYGFGERLVRRCFAA
jgi:hypothetical protein